MLHETKRALTLIIVASSLGAFLGGCAVEAAGEDGSLVLEEGEEHEEVVGDPISRSGPITSDAGDVCLYANEVPDTPMFEAETTFESGDVLVATVTLPVCLSQTCDTNREAVCTIRREGERLIVEASFSYTELRGVDCTFDCQHMAATCASEPLEAGDYEIVHDGSTAPLQVPSRMEACPELSAARDRRRRRPWRRRG